MRFQFSLATLLMCIAIVATTLMLCKLVPTPMLDVPAKLGNGSVARRVCVRLRILKFFGVRLGRCLPSFTLKPGLAPFEPAFGENGWSLNKVLLATIGWGRHLIRGS